MKKNSITINLLLLIFVSLIIPTLCINGSNRPFTLGVRDSLMIAHSFHNHPSFGIAGGMHGATYTCDVEFNSEKIEDTVNWVIDIGKASGILESVLAKYNLKNLDEVFPDGEFTTTEFMARRIQQDITEKVREEVSEFQGWIQVKLWESHKAWAVYEGEV